MSFVSTVARASIFSSSSGAGPVDKEDEEILKKSKGRAYADDVNSVLQAFEKSREWADFIKFLQKLQKVLQKYPTNHFPVMPHHVLVAKRLSQCLHPALPSGVHKKALETYDQIFERIGPHRLSRDMSVYSAGLFPLYSVASVQVRPQIIHLYETHYLQLGNGILPCLTGLLLSVLPGLEEEGTESYENVIGIMDKIRKSVGAANTHAALWKCILISPGTRFAALNYVNERFPKHVSKEQRDEYFPDRRSLVLQALVVALQDSSAPNSVLVARALLERVLLDVRFNLEEYPFYDKHELIVLTRGCLAVLTRREWSLSRRLYAWLQGGHTEADEQERHFHESAKEILVEALKEIFEADVTDEASAIKPYRILMALLDQSNIGKPILDEVVVHSIRLLHKYRTGYDFSAKFRDVARVFFDMIDQSAVWTNLGRLLTQNLKDAGRSSDKLETVEALELIAECLSFLQIDIPNTQAVLLPGLMLSAISAMPSLINPHTLLLLSNVLRFTTEHVTNFQNPSIQSVDPEKLAAYRTLQRVMMIFFQRFYKQLGDGLPGIDDETSNTRCEVVDLASALLVALVSDPVSMESGASGEIERVVLPELLDQNNTSIVEDLEAMKEFEQATPAQQMSHLLGKTSAASAPSWSSSVAAWFASIIGFCSDSDERVACAGIRTFVELLVVPNASLHKDVQSRIVEKTQYCETTAQRLWGMLDSGYESVHFQCVELLQALNELNTKVCSAVVSDALLCNDLTARVEGHEKFARLWHYSGRIDGAMTLFPRGLNLMLEALDESKPAVQLVARNWLSASLGQIERVLDATIADLLDWSTTRGPDNVYKYTYDYRHTIYILDRIKAMLRVPESLKEFMKRVSEKHISPEFAMVTEKWASNEGIRAPNDYLDLLVMVSLRFLQGRVATDAPAEDLDENELVRSSAAELLLILLSNMSQRSRGRHVSQFLGTPVLLMLKESIEEDAGVLQIRLLSLLAVMVAHCDAGDWESVSMAENHIGNTPVKGGEKSEKKAMSAKDQGLVAVPGFMQMISRGLEKSTATVLEHWVHFIDLCLPYATNQLPSYASVTVRSLCEGIARAVGSGGLDLRVLLKGLNAVVGHCLATVDQQKEDETETQKGGLGRAMAMLTRAVMPTDNGVPGMNVNSHPFKEAQRVIFDYLPNIIEAVTAAWRSTATAGGFQFTKSQRLSLIGNGGALRVPSTNASSLLPPSHMEVVLLFQPLMVHYPNEFIGAILAVWDKTARNSEGGKLGGSDLRSHLIDQLNHLSSASVENVISAASAILAKVYNPRDRKPGNRRSKSKSKIRETIVVQFVDDYVRGCKKSKEQVLKAWSSLHNLAKEALQNAVYASTLLALFQTINSFVKFVEDVVDKATRKSMQGLVNEVVQMCAMMIGQKLNLESGTGAPPPSAELDTEGAKAGHMKLQLSLQAMHMLERMLVSLVDSVWQEADEKPRSTQLFVNTLQQVFPWLHSSSRKHPEHALAAVTMLREVCNYTVTTQVHLRAWKKDVFDIFNDNEFFQCSPEVMRSWKGVMDVYLTLEKSAFQDVVNKMAVSQAQQMLFLGREGDALIAQRCRALKRLSFAIFSGENDCYLPFLPLIMEKLVDSIRLNKAELYVHVLQCMRVLIVRFSAKNLLHLWALVLPEMVRIFLQATTNPDKSEPALVLAAFKFLDLVLVVLPDYFNIYQWMFVSDRLFSDAEAGGDGAFQPYMEKLSVDAEMPWEGLPNIGTSELRRPMLTLRHIDSVSQLKPFALLLSMHVYRNSMNAAPPDYEYIERLLELDFVEASLTEAELNEHLGVMPVDDNEAVDVTQVRVILPETSLEMSPPRPSPSQSTPPEPSPTRRSPLPSSEKPTVVEEGSDEEPQTPYSERPVSPSVSL